MESVHYWVPRSRCSCIRWRTMAAPVTPHRSQRPGSFLSGTRATFTPAPGPLSPRHPGHFHPGTRATFTPASGPLSPGRPGPPSARHPGHFPPGGRGCTYRIEEGLGRRGHDEDVGAFAQLRRLLHLGARVELRQVDVVTSFAGLAILPLSLRPNNQLIIIIIINMSCVNLRSATPAPSTRAPVSTA